MTKKEKEQSNVIRIPYGELYNVRLNRKQLDVFMNILKSHRADIFTELEIEHAITEKEEIVNLDEYTLEYELPNIEIIYGKDRSLLYMFVRCTKCGLTIKCDWFTTLNGITVAMFNYHGPNCERNEIPEEWIVKNKNNE